MITWRSGRVRRSRDPSRPRVTVRGGVLRWRGLSGRQSPTSIRRGDGPGANDGVCQPLEESIKTEEG